MRRQCRVLLVDHDPLLRRLRAEILKKSGYAVYPASNTKDAKSRCKPGRYDVVLVSGPGESEALEFCDEIRHAHPEQLVLMLARPHAYIPPDACPDEVIHNSDPEHILDRINAALGAA